MWSFINTCFPKTFCISSTMYFISHYEWQKTFEIFGGTTPKDIAKDFPSRWKIPILLSDSKGCCLQERILKENHVIYYIDATVSIGPSLCSVTDGSHFLYERAIKFVYFFLKRHLKQIKTKWVHNILMTKRNYKFDKLHYGFSEPKKSIQESNSTSCPKCILQ